LSNAFTSVVPVMLVPGLGLRRFALAKKLRPKSWRTWYILELWMKPLLTDYWL